MGYNMHQFRGPELTPKGISLGSEMDAETNQFWGPKWTRKLTSFGIRNGHQNESVLGSEMDPKTGSL